MDNGIAFITGRMSRDPQFFGEGDKRRAVFAIAYNRGRGEKRKSTFIDCIAWGRMADFMESFKKGDGIMVHGDIEMDTWEKDGQKRSRLQVNISSLTATTTFGDAPSGGSENSSGGEVTIGGSNDSADIPF
jgi:single-strand DNA-binding protein